MRRYFAKPYERESKNIKVELDLSNYVTRADFKKSAAANASNFAAFASNFTSDFAAKSDLAILKGEVDKIDIGKLKTVHFNFYKLSNVVDNDLVKKLCLINQSLRLTLLILVHLF